MSHKPQLPTDSHNEALLPDSEGEHVTCAPKFTVPSFQSLLQAWGMSIHPVFQGHCDRKSQTFFLRGFSKRLVFNLPTISLFSEIAVLPNSRNFLALPNSGNMPILIFFTADFMSILFFFFWSTNYHLSS